MPVGQLLKWDLTFINQSLLTPASYKEIETPYALANGKNSHYGLGVEVRQLQRSPAFEPPVKSAASSPKT